MRAQYLPMSSGRALCPRIEVLAAPVAFDRCLPSQLIGSQGLESVGDFCHNGSRPKVSLVEFNQATRSAVLEPKTVNLTFAKCLTAVRQCRKNHKSRAGSAWVVDVRRNAPGTGGRLNRRRLAWLVQSE